MKFSKIFPCVIVVGHYFTLLIFLFATWIPTKRLICLPNPFVLAVGVVVAFMLIVAFEWMLPTNVGCCCAYIFLYESAQSEIKSLFIGFLYACVYVCVFIFYKKVDRNYKILVSSCVLSWRNSELLELRSLQLLTSFQRCFWHTETHMYISIHCAGMFVAYAY